MSFNILNIGDFLYFNNDVYGVIVCIQKRNKYNMYLIHWSNLEGNNAPFGEADTKIFRNNFLKLEGTL